MTLGQSKKSDLSILHLIVDGNRKQTRRGLNKTKHRFKRIVFDLRSQDDATERKVLSQMEQRLQKNTKG